MNKPIISENNIYFLNLIDFTKRSFKKYLKISALLTFLSFLYFTFKTPAYTSSVSFYSNYTNSSNLLSSLSIINNLGGSEMTHLGYSINDYLKSDRLVNDIIFKKYKINNQDIELIEFWGENYDKIFFLNPIALIASLNKQINLNQTLSENEKKYYYVKDKLLGSISFSEDKITSLNTINITIKKYPDLAEQISNNIFLSVANFSSELSNTKATEKRVFVEQRLSSIATDLEIAENKLLKFLNENKSYNSSPTLILEKNRLDRSIMLYNQIYISLSDQLELIKIDEQDNTSPISVLDKSTIKPFKAGMGVFKKTFTIFVIFSLLFLFLETYKNRKNLFINLSID